MQLIKEAGGYVLLGYEMVQDLKLEIDSLKCFMNNNDILVFNCMWMDVYSMEKRDLTDEAKEVFKNLLHMISRSPEDYRENIKVKEFIDSRTIFVNSEWIYPGPRPIENCKNIWFKPLNDEEIIRAIDVDEFYKCVIKSDDLEFAGFRYALMVLETDDAKALYIIEFEENSFMTKVLPRLQDLFSINIVF